MHAYIDNKIEPDEADMRADVAARSTYYCNRCEKTFDCEAQPFETSTARYFAGTNVLAGHTGSADDTMAASQGTHSCSFVYLDESAGEGREEDVWWCYDGCFHHDEGEEPAVVDPEEDEPVGPVWVCGKCQTSVAGTDAQRAAAECCKPRAA